MNRAILNLCICLTFVLTAGCSASHQQVKQVLYGCDERSVSEEMLGSHLGDIRGTKCTATYKDGRPDNAVIPPATLGKKNREILDRKYAEELHYLDGRSPEVGLALSGGGTRSASFNIGVMKALEESGILDEVDVISSVSGGSYASFWYYMQNYYLIRDNLEPPDADKRRVDVEPGGDYDRARREAENYKEADLLFFTDLDYCDAKKLNNASDPYLYRFQYTLQQSSKILNLEKKPGLWTDVKNGLQYSANLGVQTLSVPFHWVLNGLVFNWNANINPYRHFYQNGLERTYAYVPLSYNLETFVNDYQVMWQRINAYDVSFADMQKYLVDYKAKNNKTLPYFIINATADYGSWVQQSDKKKMLQSVYEFTPWGCGSGLTGYVPVEGCPSDISMGRAVSISGAAVDSQNEVIDIAGNSEGTVITLAALMHVLNLDIGYNIRNHDPNVSAAGSYLYKLIPFPLYFLVDWAIGKQVNDIHLSDGGHIENLGVFSLVRRGVKNIIAVDAESDATSIFSSLNRLKQNLKKEMGLELDWKLDDRDKDKNSWCAMDVHCSPTEKAIIKGKIIGLVDEMGENNPLNLYYIKLSMKRDALQTTDDPCRDRYPYTVVNYAAKHDIFPHESTSDVFYGPEQYKAYRDLGYTIGRKLDKSELKLSDL